MNTKRTVLLLLILGIVTPAGSVKAADPAQDLRDAWTQSHTSTLARVENEARLRQLFQSMVREMELLQQTADPVQRQQLMRQHSSHLHETMMLLRVLGGRTMQQMIGGHTNTRPVESTEAESLASKSPQERLTEIEGRLDMLQMMVEAMLDHLTMTGGTR